MELLDDIKNIQPISDKVITNKELNKTINDIFKDVEREHKLLQTFAQAGVIKVYKQIGVGAYEFVGFDLGNSVDKTDIKIITPFGIINVKNNESK